MNIRLSISILVLSAVLAACMTESRTAYQHCGGLAVDLGGDLRSDIQLGDAAFTDWGLTPLLI